MENTKSLYRKKSGSSERHWHSNSLKDTAMPTHRSEEETTLKREEEEEKDVRKPERDVILGP